MTTASKLKLGKCSVKAVSFERDLDKEAPVLVEVFLESIVRRLLADEVGSLF